MITLNDFSISDDSKLMTISYTLTTSDTTTSLKLYIGDKYLTNEYINLTSLAVGENVTITLHVNDPIFNGHYSKEVFDGIFTITIDTSFSYNKEAAISNLYYSSICLANMIIAHNSLDEWNEVNTLYMFLNSVSAYLQVGQIEQALGSYDRVNAICKSKLNTMFSTDIAACGEGLGCWIVDGTYVINR